MVSREGRVYMADMGYGQNVVFEPYIQGFIAATCWVTPGKPGWANDIIAFPTSV